MQELRQPDIWISSPSSKKNPKPLLTLQSRAISENVWVRHWEQIGGDRPLETQHFMQQRGVDAISQQKIQTSHHFSLTLYTGSCTHPWQSHSYTHSVLSLLDTWSWPVSAWKIKYLLTLYPLRPTPSTLYLQAGNRKLIFPLITVLWRLQGWWFHWAEEHNVKRWVEYRWIWTY